jgi:hypothetical protein
MTSVYTYNASVVTDNLDKIPRSHGMHTPSNKCVRWDGTFDFNGTKRNLGTNANCIGVLTSSMLSFLRANGHSAFLNNSTTVGGFTVKSDASEEQEHCRVEQVKHSFHFVGKNFDQWGGNYLTLYKEFIESLGMENYTVEQDTYVVSVNVRMGAINSVAVVQTGTPTPVDKPVEPIDDDDSDTDDDNDIFSGGLFD